MSTDFMTDTASAKDVKSSASINLTSNVRLGPRIVRDLHQKQRKSLQQSCFSILACLFSRRLRLQENADRRSSEYVSSVEGGRLYYRSSWLAWNSKCFASFAGLFHVLFAPASMALGNGDTRATGHTRQLREFEKKAKVGVRRSGSQVWSLETRQILKGPILMQSEEIRLDSVFEDTTPC